MISDLIPSLPNDIALVVLVGVPCQFHSVLKSVCKSWNSLFSDPSFYTLCKLGWQERRSYLHGPDTDVPPRCKPLQRHPQNLAKTASSYSVTRFQKANLPLQSDAFGSKTVIIDHWSGTNIICMFDFRHPGKERHIFSKVREILPDHYTDPFKGACLPASECTRERILDTSSPFWLVWCMESLNPLKGTNYVLMPYDVQKQSSEVVYHFPDTGFK